MITVNNKLPQRSPVSQKKDSDGVRGGAVSGDSEAGLNLDRAGRSE